MSRLMALPMALMLAASAVGVCAAQPISICERCDRSISVSAEQWACLLQRLPDIGSTQTETVFFTLSPQACKGGFRTVPTGSGVVIPGSEGNNRLFRLSRDQVACLARKAPSVPSGAQVTFDFDQEC